MWRPSGLPRIPITGAGQTFTKPALTFKSCERFLKWDSAPVRSSALAWFSCSKCHLLRWLTALPLQGGSFTLTFEGLLWCKSPTFRVNLQPSSHKHQPVSWTFTRSEYCFYCVWLDFHCQSSKKLLKYPPGNSLSAIISTTTSTVGQLRRKTSQISNVYTYNFCRIQAKFDHVCTSPPIDI